MSLLIDLFSDASITSKVNQQAALAIGKTLAKPEKFYFQQANRMDLYEKYLEFYEEEKEERYIKLRGLNYDKYMEVEKMGASTVSRSNTLYIDMRDNLDIVLDRLTNTDGEITRGIPYYSNISKVLLDAEQREVGCDVTFNDIISSENVMKHITDYGYDDNPMEFLKQLIHLVEDITRYIATHIVMNGSKGTTIRSLRPAEVVITTSDVFDELAVLVNGRKYPLKFENINTAERLGEADDSWLLRK